ncbi:MBL fold metallo-hydrolase [Amphiplicatus metriothermophilus]|uniref:Ribonuclease Z n=1 Tax=Amphiplicatus metriothermophilus TaxID=1519374 RepID=A0A239Q093_9PROT|nr:MBL fold metallo-hydrolase [Amphiplicatus metriothermophilus]MBB5520063.1 ribonuclease Z [Amphiplicatus metriothermophilus]SNT75850.1 ribonuclease Z [Amphiplicatus metriothermophilus]
MRIVIWIAAGLVLAAGALVAALRAPAVEDALFERALAKGFGRDRAALFDGDGLKIFFCGTGSPLPSAKRAQTCTAIFAGGRFFLVDAGTGSWETLQAAGVPAGRLAGVFLTHFHSDHIGDLGEANLGSWVAGRPTPLAVYGPSGVERVVGGLNEAYALDSEYRTAHHGKAVAPPRAAGLRAQAFDGRGQAVVYEEGGLTVSAFPVTHDPVDPAVGYRFDYKGRSVVVSGDTAYSDSLVRAAAGADLLIHEAQANHMVAEMQAAAERAGAASLAMIFADIPSYHTSPEEAARAANEAGVGYLILTHLTPAPDAPLTQRIFLRGVKEVRRRNVALARDGMLVLLPAAGGIDFTKL